MGRLHSVSTPQVRLYLHFGPFCSDLRAHDYVGLTYLVPQATKSLLLEHGSASLVVWGVEAVLRHCRCDVSLFYGYFVVVVVILSGVADCCSGSVLTHVSVCDLSNHCYVFRWCHWQWLACF